MAEKIISWFVGQGGIFDKSSIGFTHFQGLGEGAIALQDIPEGHVFFSIPYDLALTTRTSSLSRLFGETSWKELKLHEGWSGLILCMMWEAAQGEQSKWSTYMLSMPSTFDTPMFWPESDLAELKGTAIENKIGKEDAERDYHEKVLPAINSRTDLFPEDKVPNYYSIERYHMMGSRILSRSFDVGEQNGGDAAADDANEPIEDTSAEVEAMDVDPISQENDKGGADVEATMGVEDSDSDDFDDDLANVAMLPMADMLNACYGCENAKLFYEKDGLKMVATKIIPKGEQIWNTYGNPPNSDLLRRYGHVDVIPLVDGEEGNPADVIEIPANYAVDAVNRHNAVRRQMVEEDHFKERIDWWLENGGEDIFLIEMDYVVPKLLISFIKTLMLSTQEWEKVREKDKFPKAKPDSDTYSVMILLAENLLDKYETSLDDDETLLKTHKSGSSPLSLNKRHAIIVRLGEKRILTKTLGKLRAALEVEKKNFADRKKGKESEMTKRKRISSDQHLNGSSKRSKQ